MADPIDRQAAIVTAVKAAIDWHRLANPQYSIAYCIGEAMNALPSAEPKKGKWIKEPYSEGLVIYRCSECMSAMGLGSKKSKWYKFCPNCGADMRGEKDE